jgi:hypothetical protein
MITPWTVLILAVAFLCSCSHAPMNAPTLHAKTRKIVLCKLDPPREDRVVFAPTDHVLAEGEDCSKLLSSLLSATDQVDYPAVGHLAYLAALDDRGRPLAMLNVVCFNCTVVIDRCKADGAKIAQIVESDRYSGRIAMKFDPVFVRRVYEFVKRHDKTGFRKLQMYHKRHGNTVEKLLFDGVHRN